jgi:hypothetical protein
MSIHQHHYVIHWSEGGRGEGDRERERETFTTTIIYGYSYISLLVYSTSSDHSGA